MARPSSTLRLKPGLLMGVAMALDLYGVIGVRQSERQYKGNRLPGLLADQIELGLDRRAVALRLPSMPELP